jgi:Ca2+-transporting ATPase
MITGDHPETAAAIAREIGILDQNALMVTGSELNRLTEEELDMKVERVRSIRKTFTRTKIKYCEVAAKKKTFCSYDRRWSK